MFFQRTDGKFLRILSSLPSSPLPILMIRLGQIYNPFHENFHSTRRARVCICVFFKGLSIGVCVCWQMSVWVSKKQQEYPPPCLTIFLSDPLRHEQRVGRRDEKKWREDCRSWGVIGGA